MIDFDISILINLIVVLLLILGYLDNRKNIKLIIKKDQERKDINDALKQLKKTTASLNKLPEHIYFTMLHDAINDISREVYEKDKLNLTIEFQNLDLKEFNNTNLINTKSLRKYVKKFLGNYHNRKFYSTPSIEFISRPDVISCKSLEFDGFFCGLAIIEENINKLSEIENSISFFADEIIENIEKTYEEILKLFADGLQNKVYNFEFDRNMKTSEIEKKINIVLNYNEIVVKTEYLATDLTSKIDELRRDLVKQFLT